MTLLDQRYITHRRVYRLTRRCGENEQEEVSALSQEKRKNRYHENDNEAKIANVIKSAASDITNAELTLVAKEV